MRRLEIRTPLWLRPEQWRRTTRILRIFAPFAAKHRWRILGALGCVIGSAAVQIARPWPLKYLFDSVLIPRMGGADSSLAPIDGPFPLGLVAAICGAILAIGLLASLFQYGETLLSASAGQRIATSIRRRLFGHMLTLPLEWHRTSRRGELVNLLGRDTDHLRELLVNLLLSVSSSVFIVVAMTIVMFAMNAKLALICLALLPFIAGFTIRTSRRMREETHKQRRKESHLVSSAQEVLHAIPIVKLFGQEPFERRRFAGTNRSSLRAGLRMKRLEAALGRRVELILAAGACVFVWVGVKEVWAGRATAGELLIFASYLKSFQKPLRRLTRSSTQIARATVCGERVQEVLDVPGEQVEAPDETPEGERPRSVTVRFDDVSFAYGDGTPVFANASFEIPAGSRVAIVGPNGGGKSTLMQLISRLLAPTTGRILFNGTDIAEMPLAWVRRQMTAVFQETYLFRGTIEENLRYGSRNGDVALMEEAVRSAQAAPFVAKKVDGLRTVLGDDGLTLSGGQRRRLAVARALLRDAPIVLLDEPTAHLDEVGVGEVRLALEALAAGRTTFWSSHDISHVADADCTLVVGGGGVRLHAGPPEAEEMHEPAGAVNGRPG